MLTKIIIRLANIYDQLGQNLKADALDAFLQKYAQSKEEPTPEDLMQEESWLQEEGLEEEDPLEGLSGDDLKGAQAYLGGAQPEQIPELLKKLKEQQAEVLQELSKLMPGKSSPDLLPKQEPIMPEASLLKDFQKLANLLDRKQMHKIADKVDAWMNKLAQGLPPDDEDMDFEDDDFEEPSTEELLKMEDSPEGLFDQALMILQKLSDGAYAVMEDAEADAAEWIQNYDRHYKVTPEGIPPLPTPPPPDNVIPFSRS